MGDEEGVTGESSSTKQFAHFRMSGDQFEAPGMPANATRELAYFREAIVAFARELWLDANPGRLRVPSNFEAAFDLRLTGVVEQGSAKPNLVLHRRTDLGVSVGDLDEWTGIYSMARDQATQALIAVGQNASAASDLAPAPRAALARIGTTLAEQDSIQLGDPDEDGLRATATKVTRTRLRLVTDEAFDEADTLELVGVIVEFDGQGRSFMLKSRGVLSKCVLAPETTELAEFVRSVLALDGVTAPDVTVSGQTLDAEASRVHLFNVDQVTIVRTLEEKLIVARMNALNELEPGWFGPDSVPPTDDVRRVITLAANRLANLGVAVDLIPRADGGVAIEWTRGPREFTAQVLPGQSLVLIIDNVETDELQEVETDYSNEALFEFLERGSLV